MDQSPIPAQSTLPRLSKRTHPVPQKTHSPAQHYEIFIEEIPAENSG